VTLASQQVLTNVLTPVVPTTADTVYFVELLLRQNGSVVDRNVYWLPTTPDVINWNKTLGSPQASMTSYANLKALQSLPQATVSATAATVTQAGPNGADRLTTVAKEARCFLPSPCNEPGSRPRDSRGSPAPKRSR